MHIVSAWNQPRYQRNSMQMELQKADKQGKKLQTTKN